MTQPNSDGNALPSRLLQDVLAEAHALAMQAHDLLAPVARRRTSLRQALADEGQILRIDAHTPMPPLTIAAVDGGLVREHLYAADLMVAVAASAGGRRSGEALPLSKRHYATVRTHESENDRLLSAAMATLELLVIAELGHDLRILDGSHGTPVIALSTALSARSASVADAAAALVTDEVVAAVAALANPDLRETGGEIIALPKADSSHAFSDLYRTHYDLDLPGGDRFVAAQVLEPGEMLYPRPATELENLHFTIPDDGPASAREAARRLNDAVAPLRLAAQRSEVLVTYLKPTSADIVIKIEFRVSEPLPDTTDARTVAVTEGLRLARYMSDETPGPHMQEPFAQYAVDRIAKNVSTAADALKHGMLANLPDGGKEYALLLARSYRTGSVAGGFGPAGGSPAR